MAEDYLSQLMKEVKEKNPEDTTKQIQKKGANNQKSVEKNRGEKIDLNESIQKNISAEKNYSSAKSFGKHLAEEEQIARVVQNKEIDQEKLNTKIKSTPELSNEEDEKKTDNYSTIEQEFSGTQKIEIDSYGKVKIFNIPGNPLKFYYVPTIRPTPQERKIINTLKEVTTRLISISPFKIRDPEQRRIIYKQKVIEVLQNSPSLKIPSGRIDYYADAVVREMVGYGLIDDLIKDDRLEEIMVIAPKRPVYVFHREHEMMVSNIEFIEEQEIEDLINRIGREIGRRVDVASPLLDARLLDGSRVNATIPPASISGGTLTIRKFKADPYSIIDLIKIGTINAEVAAFLWLCVEGMGTRPANILIAGGTGSGKTTLLNVLATFISDRERIITIEDTAELSLALKHWIRMEARPPGLEGTGELKMDILVKNALRMRPDRILVGEIRHKEAFTFFTAINTGHDGALSKDSLIQLSDGNIVEIQKIAEKFMQNPIKEKNYEFAEIREDVLVPSFNKSTLKIEDKKITRVWRKKNDEELVKIKLKSGKELLLTNDHPLYKIYNGLQEIAAGDLKEGDWLATPTAIEITGKEKIIQPQLLGMIYGDGHVGHECIEFVNNENSLTKSFEQFAKEITPNKVVIKNYGTYSRVKFHDKKIIKELNEKFNIPIGNKTKTFKFEKEILCGENDSLAKLVRGLFDCEAHVNLEANCIQFSTSNKDLSRKLPLILQRFGVMSSIYAQKKDGKGNFGPYYRISIYGKENITNFENKIGFSHEKKKQKLMLLSEKSKKSLDLFPNISKIIRDARAEAGLSQTELGAMLGTKTWSTISSYENEIRNPSREQLQKISELLGTETAKQIKIMSESNLRFEKVVSISKEKYTDYVYDLTVEGNHNYITNGIVVSNCLGTVHANSPEETIIRVTNPPMEVPEIMLSGLDFILMEHRYHDAKKGTIRRVSAVAEVSGSLEGETKTKLIYQRDPVRDMLERTLINSEYVAMLQAFTGSTKEQIEKEIDDRKKFLEYLVKNNIRSFSEVSTATKNFLIERTERAARG